MFHWYGIFIGLAIVVGWSIAEKIEPRVNKIAPLVIGYGLVGARIYHVIDLWSYYSQNLAQIVAVWNGGMSIWGGIMGGGIGLVILNHKFSNSQIWGAIATALPIAQAIGRIGNGFNGEFMQKVWILPWWGAEAILDLLLFGILSGLSSSTRLRAGLRGVSSKAKVGTYLVGYGLIRYVLHPFGH